MLRLAQYVYSLTLALWVGGIAIFTFVVAPAIFRSFDRDMAAVVIGKLFDGYFIYNLALSVFALIFALAALPGRYVYKKISLLLIAAAIVINAYVAFSLHPQVREVKRQVASFETMPKDSPARKEFSRLHAVSAVLNILLLADGAALIYLSYSGLKK